MHIKIGCDPEFFLKKGDKYWSGAGIIPGTKGEPYPVGNGAIQLDGMAAEFNIHPAITEKQFVGNIYSVLASLRSMVPQEYSFEFSATAHFEPDHFYSQPPECLELGCNPDYNAYTKKVNDPPNAATFMRTAAGHIHIGWTNNADEYDEEHIENCVAAVKQLDIALGIPSVVMDNNKERRDMYGKAGCFRPKPYGVEYRVLSNFWLHNEDTIKWAYRNTYAAIEKLHKGERLFDRYDETEVQRIINTSDNIAAGQIMRELAAA